MRTLTPEEKQRLRAILDKYLPFILIDTVVINDAVEEKAFPLI